MNILKYLLIDWAIVMSKHAKSATVQVKTSHNAPIGPLTAHFNFRPENFIKTTQQKVWLTPSFNDVDETIRMLQVIYEIYSCKVNQKLIVWN